MLEIILIWSCTNVNDLIFCFSLCCVSLYVSMFHQKEAFKKYENGFYLPKKLFLLSRYSNFAFSSSLLFFTCRSLLNLQEKLLEGKFWSFLASSCFNLFKNKLFNVLKSREGLIMKLSQLINYYIRTIFIEKYAKKCAP